MATIEQIAQAALERDSLTLRVITLEFLQAKPSLTDIPRPETEDERLLAACASLLELFAQRLGQPAPDWTGDVRPLAEPFYLLKSVERMKRLRALCEAESPEPLRRFGFYAPPEFLEMA